MANTCWNYIEVEGIDCDIELFLEKISGELKWLDDVTVDWEDKTVRFSTKWSPEIEEVKNLAAGGTLFLNYFYEELGSDVYGVAIISPEGECEIIDLTSEEIILRVDELGNIDYESLEQLLKNKILETKNLKSHGN